MEKSNGSCSTISVYLMAHTKTHNASMLVINEFPFRGVSGAGLLGESFIQGCIAKKIKLVVVILETDEINDIGIFNKYEDLYVKHNVKFYRLSVSAKKSRRHLLFK